VDDRTLISELAAGAGFHAVRFTPVRPTPDRDRFDAWLARGRHADQHWLVRGRDVRVDPRFRAPWAKTAVVLSVHHPHRRPPDPGGRTGRVASYAWGRDYHNLVGKRLRRLRRLLDEAGIRGWGGVDTAPILERAWANASGLGFSGKNTLQIVPGTSSFFFLSVLFVDRAIAPDRPLGDHCGSCVRCLTACPTNAFRGPHDLDAARCISYWTIEAEGLAPEELRPAFGRWVFGCDDCQTACPHNHDPPDPDEDDLAPRHAWLDLDEILSTPDDALDARFTGTPLRRAGAVGLKRNALVALGNLGDPDAARVIHDHAVDHPAAVVREGARWALGRLTPPRNAPPRGASPRP
jgi:epoxyqueuosine reductase